MFKHIGTDALYRVVFTKDMRTDAKEDQEDQHGEHLGCQKDQLVKAWQNYREHWMDASVSCTQNH